MEAGERISPQRLGWRTEALFLHGVQTTATAFCALTTPSSLSRGTRQPFRYAIMEDLPVPYYWNKTRTPGGPRVAIELNRILD